MHVLAVAPTRAPCIHRSQLPDELRIGAPSLPLLWQGADLGPTLLPPSEHHKIGRNVTTLDISNLSSNLVEAVLYAQKLPGGPQGKQHNYVGFVTLGNQPGAAKGPINSIRSPTGISLPKNVVRRHPMCTQRRQLLASSALLPLQLACTLSL